MMLMSAHPAATRIQPGLEPFPGYCLDQLLGRGSFGEVWQASAPDGRTVALKFMRCRDSLADAREIRAIQSLRELSHPNLMDIERIWCWRDHIVMAMELAEGDLDDLLQAYQTELHTPIVAESVCFYLAQVAEALDFLNTRRHLIGGRLVAIQHCDIKPSNLLLLGETVKVSDFGLASLTTQFSQNHQRAGTIDFAAPEVFLGQVSERTDQFALAVTYCKLRSGQVPFREVASFREEALKQRGAPDLSMLSAGEQAIVARALARAPQDRWPSCREFIARLSCLAF